MVSQSAKALNTSQLLYWSLFFNEDIAVQALLFQFPRFIHPLFSLCAFDLFYSFSVRSKDRKSIFLFLLYSFSLFSLFLFSLLLSPLSSFPFLYFLFFSVFFFLLIWLKRVLFTDEEVALDRSELESLDPNLSCVLRDTWEGQFVPVGDHLLQRVRAHHTHLVPLEAPS